MKKDDWNFTDLIEEAGYSSTYCFVDSDGGFVYEDRWKVNGVKKAIGVKFIPLEIEMTTNKVEYIKQVISAAYERYR